MAEENKLVETEPKEHIEVLADGKELNQNHGLASIFDKIAEGKEGGKTADEVLATPEPEVKPEPKVEPKVEDKTKDPVEVKLGDEPEKKEPEEISRESLRKQIEVKPEEKKTDPEKKPEDVLEEELKVLPHDSPKVERRIKGLLAKIDQVKESEVSTRKEIEVRDAKLAELTKELEKTRTGDPKDKEKTQKELDELAMYRRRYEIEKDPEVKAKFESRIDSAETTIIDTLKNKGASQGLLDIIKQEGGWNKFSRSNVAVKLSDGNTTTAAALADQIVSQLPLGDRRVIDAASIEQVQVDRDRSRYLQEQQETAVKYFKQKEDDQKVAQENAQKETQQRAEFVEKWIDKTFKEEDYFQDKELPAKADESTKKEIEEHNRFADQARKLFRKSLAVRKPEDALEIMKDSVKLYAVQRQLNKAQAERDRFKAEAEDKQKQIDKFRNGAKTVNKGGSISSGGTDPASTQPKARRSLEESFEAVARGEILTSQPNEE